jgi:hypothetical protein
MTRRAWQAPRVRTLIDDLSQCHNALLLAACYPQSCTKLRLSPRSYGLQGRLTFQESAGV